MAGFQVRGNVEWFQGLYAATKFGVVALSESLRADLEPYGIGVSVLAPSSREHEHLVLRPGASRALRGSDHRSSPEAHIERLAARGMEPSLVAELVAEAIEHERMYVFPHSANRVVVDERNDRILAGFDETAAVLERLTGPDA